MFTADEYTMIEAFKKIGLKPEKATETAKNSKLSKRLYTIIEKVHKSNLAYFIRQEQGTLLYLVASYTFTEEQLSLVLEYIFNDKITSSAQVKGFFIF